MAIISSNLDRGETELLVALVQIRLRKATPALTITQMVGCRRRRLHRHVISSERLLTRLAVQTFTGVSLYLAWEKGSTLSSGFCCLNAYDISTNSCQTESHGTYNPFSLHASTAIYNRTDGSTTLPSSLIASITTVTNRTSTVTVTVTANHTDIATVAASIAVPLGIMLLLVTTSAIVFWRKRQ